MFLPYAAGALIRVVTGQAVSTIYMHASWVDMVDGASDSSGDVFGATNEAVTTAVTKTIVGTPASAHTRKLRFASIRNGHASSSCDITFQHYDGTTSVDIYKHTLLAGEQVHYVENVGLYVLDATGTPGRWLKSSVLTVGSGNLTTTAQTNLLHFRAVAGGGAGGGNPATANTAGGGGSAGGYGESWETVSPNTAYAYVAGAKGTGVSGAAGNDGADTTLIISGTTFTMNRGKGGNVGVAAVAALPGVAAAVSTNCDVNGGGAPGTPGNSASNAALLCSGIGGSGPFGAGGAAVKATQTGLAANGYGAGGGGSVATTAAAQVGGAGSDGMLIAEEYS